MTHIEGRSIRQALVIMVFAALTLLLAGAGCSDNGSPMGSDNGNGDGNEDVSFSADVLPVFMDRCDGSGCHVGTASPALGLNLSSYAGVAAGSDNGDVVIAGNAQDSELIKRLEGRAAGDRMPLVGDPLDQETIDVIRAWIDQGAENN